MPLYENERNAENRIKIKKQWQDAVIFGTEGTTKKVIELIKEHNSKTKHTITIAFCGWYGVNFNAIVASMEKAFGQAGLKVEIQHVCTILKSKEDIEKYKRPFLTDDPSFGWVNDSGVIADIMDKDKLEGLKKKLQNTGKGKAEELAALIIYGSGSAVPELSDIYDLRFYFDTTKESVLWTMWDGNLVPFGTTETRKDYWWKEYYYCDFYLLNEQKHYGFKQMDYYVQAIEPDQLNLVPREAFDGILSTLVKYPTKNVKYAQPGAWGAYRYKDTRWDIPDLPCSAWNSLIAPNELSMIVDIGREKMLKMPAENLIQYPEEFVGPYMHKTYPRLIPFYIWMDDGYFPEPQSAERTSMPIHCHPSTEYNNRNFNEIMGRYETYYIAEAYEGANTWMGYKDDANLEQWQQKCRETDKTGTKIENWKDYINNWDTNIGDLFLIPPGTAHGHGGNQMVVEMDTVPSVAGTEYTFIAHNFAQPSWDSKTNTMTAKPMGTQLNRYFETDICRRRSWVKEHLRARPKVIKWTHDYWIDRYNSYSVMPFEIERISFFKKAEYDTKGKFMQMLCLTFGDRVVIRSKAHPERCSEVEWLQGVCIPACFGEYEIVNMKEGFCRLVLIRWKKG